MIQSNQVSLKLSQHVRLMLVTFQMPLEQKHRLSKKNRAMLLSWEREREKAKKQTSRISLILAPPLPIIDPHWLAGTTNRKVIGGIVVQVCFKSYVKINVMKGVHWITRITSSNFWQIIPNALAKVSIVPTIVTMRSGVVPSLIFIRAPLWNVLIWINQEALWTGNRLLLLE